MSYLVLHMDKFKRKPYAASRATTGGNGRATATPDKAFFDGLTPEETRRFFEESKAFLTEFVWARRMSFPQWFTWMKRRRTCTSPSRAGDAGREAQRQQNLYPSESAETASRASPPICKAGASSLNAAWNRHPVPRKRHLDTREFKQQQEALEKLIQESGRDFPEIHGSLSTHWNSVRKS